MSPYTDLISGFDESDLLQLLESSDPGTRIQLQNILEFDAITQVSDQSSNAEATRRSTAAKVSPNPDLPEIVLLHGISDCHLANVIGRRNRIWLDPIELFKGRFTRDLPLLDDGITDQLGVRMEPDGYVEKKYNKALSAWTSAGFRNHVFCYDWRRSITSSADQFNSELRNLPSVKGGEKVVLVAHSMGGLIASTFASKFEDWDELVSHCVFVGSPLGGSYSVPMTMLGHSPSFKRMDRLSIWDSLEDFQRMAASFPGLVDMLPNPDLMPEAADFYEEAGWPGSIKPLQVHLDASLRLKPKIWESPIFQTSTHLIAQGIETTSAMPWNANKTDRASDIVSTDGDGAALTNSSLAPGLRAFLVPGEHGTLVNEALVYDAIAAIANGKTPGLTTFDPDKLTRSRRITHPHREPIPESTGIDVEATTLRERRLADEMAVHFSSESVVRARTQVAGEPGFSRENLVNNDFSWKNSLSLAIASLDAYRSDQPQMITRATEEWGFAHYAHFDEKETQGFVCWDDEVVVLSFRGTEKKISDWLRNLKLAAHDTGQYGSVHRGFHEGFKVVETTIRKLLADADADRKKLWITGHSLGGAIAAIAGAELYRDFPAFGFSTYGQPKVGKTPLADFYEGNYRGRYFRFKNNNDIVTRIPPGFDHLGDLFWFDRNGELQEALRTRGTAIAPEALESKTDLSLSEFSAMQEALDVALSPPTRGNFRLPPADYQIEGLSLIPSLGISDHSIAGKYIPIIRKYV
ncbi:MAG: alpha/beta fold hydrolase [Verrucomicrobiales bacterium]|nr:alpha/beta fold hydrolase [Verrucomicrobiales bacterium]